MLKRIILSSLFVFVLLPLTASNALSHKWGIVNIAHRGGIVEGYPENTLKAFRKSIEIGADVLEIDLRGTKDGAVIIMHDSTVDRTTDGSGKVEDLTLAEIKKLDAGKGEKVPTYEEVLDLISTAKVKLLLHIKESPKLNKEKIVQITTDKNALLDVIAGVITIDDYRMFRALNPNIRTLGFIKSSDDIEQFVTAGIDIIRLWDHWIIDDAALVQKVQNMGKPVWTTAKDHQTKESLTFLLDNGVNGVICDYPELLNEVINDWRK